MTHSTVRPEVLQPVYSTLEWLLAPVRWLVTTVLLGTIFYVLITPLGWVLRITGRIGSRAENHSYWVERDPDRDDPSRAFRQS